MTATTSPPRTERWAAVVRVSHMGARKAGDDAVHADRDQLDAIRRYAAAQRGDVLVDVLEPELDVSGGLPLERRPSLLEAIEGVEAGAYDAIAVAYLSRFGRNVREQLRAWDRVEAAGGRVVVVREQIDTATAAGRLQRNFLLSMAEHEREMHGEAFEERRRQATAAGIWQRRQTPRGYDRDPATRRLVPNADAREVRRAFRDVAAGAHVVALADRLEMTASGVRQLLRNRVYLGELRVGQHVNPAAHEPIVSVEDFEAAQAALERAPRPPRSSGPPALLAGLVRCSGCGHVMSRGTTAGRYVTYACHGRHSGARCPSPASVSAPRLDELVDQVAVAELARLSVTAREGRGTEDARGRLHAAERELGTYVQAVSAADIGPEAFAAGARQRREQVDAARAALHAELARRPAALPTGTGAEAWATLDVRERNTVLRGLVESVVVARAGGRGVRVPLEQRVRVLKHGAGVPVAGRGGGRAAGIVPVALPDLDDERVLRVPVGEHTA